MLNVVMLSVNVLNVVMLSVNVLNVVMLSVVAPLPCHICKTLDCFDKYQKKYFVYETTSTIQYWT